MRSTIVDGHIMTLYCNIKDWFYTEVIKFNVNSLTNDCMFDVCNRAVNDFSKSTVLHNFADVGLVYRITWMETSHISVIMTSSLSTQFT